MPGLGEFLKRLSALIFVENEVQSVLSYVVMENIIFSNCNYIFGIIARQ